jgi:hypothetical protein
MITGPKDYAKTGDWNAVCAVCGFKYKASELVKRWDGVYVCRTDWEPRHPQELIKMPRERPAPSFPTLGDNYIERVAAPVDPNSL